MPKAGREKGTFKRISRLTQSKPTCCGIARKGHHSPRQSRLPLISFQCYRSYLPPRLIQAVRFVLALVSDLRCFIFSSIRLIEINNADHTASIELESLVAPLTAKFIASPHLTCAMTLPSGARRTIRHEQNTP